MKRLPLLCLLLSLGCATIGAPDWVGAGIATCGPINCRGVLSAVGKADLTPQTATPPLRRAAAGSAARAELLKKIETSLGMKTEDPMHPVLSSMISGVEIYERWVATDQSEYALAELNRTNLHLALGQQTQLTPETRNSIENRLSPLFTTPR